MVRDPKPRTFWFHYNKPASKAQGRNVLTVHWMGKCHLVNSLSCDGHIETVARRQQPRCILKGMATDITFGESKGHVHAMIQATRSMDD